MAYEDDYTSQVGMTKSPEEVASLDLGSQYAMQSSIVPQLEQVKAGGTPMSSGGFGLSSGMAMQAPVAPRSYHPGYTAPARQEESFMTKLGNVLMAGGTKPGDIPAPFKMKLMENELELKRSEEARAWQNFDKTQQLADDTMKVHNQEAMRMGLQMLPQFKGMIHAQRDPEKRTAMTNHLKTILEGYAPGLGRVLDTMNTAPHQVLGADYMAQHPVYGQQVQELMGDRSYEDVVNDPQMKKMTSIIGSDLMSEVIGHFSVAQHEKLLSGKMKQPEFEKIYKEVLMDPAFGPPNASKIALAESMINTDEGEGIMANFQVMTNKNALALQGKQKTPTLKEQMNIKEQTEIATILQDHKEHPGKYTQGYIDGLVKRKDVFLGQAKVASAPGYNPQNRVNQRFNELVNKAGLSDSGIPKDPDEIRNMPVGPLKTKAIQLQGQASQEQDENAAKEAMRQKMEAPGDTSGYIRADELKKTGRAVAVKGDVSQHDLLTNKNYVKATPEQRKQLSDFNTVSFEAENLFTIADKALTGKGMTGAYGEAAADAVLSGPEGFFSAEKKALTKSAFPELATYVASRESTLGKFARSISGEVGVLTDQDVGRVRNLFAVGGDTKTIRAAKQKALKSILALNRKFNIEMLAGEMLPEDITVLKNSTQYRDTVNGIFGDLESKVAAHKELVSGGEPGSIPAAPQGMSGSAPAKTDAATSAFSKMKQQAEQRKGAKIMPNMNINAEARESKILSRAELDASIESNPEMIGYVEAGDENEFNRRHAEIYRENNLDPSGEPLRAAQRAIKGVSKFTGVSEPVVHGVASAVLPTIGTIAGAAVGAPGGLAGAAIGGSGGSFLGSAANSLLGIDEPMGVGDAAMAIGAPLVPPVVAKAVPGAFKIAKGVLPGMGAGLNELAGEQFAAKLGSMRVTRDAVDAMGSALSSVHGKFKIPAEKMRGLFMSEIDELVKQDVKGLPVDQSYVAALKKFAQTNFPKGTTSISFDDLMTIEKGLNRIKGERPGEIWAKASGTLIDELEAATNNPKLSKMTVEKAKEGLEAFKKFIATNRKFQADEEMTKLLSSKGMLKPATGDPNLIQIDQKLLTRGLDENKALNRAYSKAEIKEMKDSILDLGYISKPPPSGNDASSFIKRYGVGGVAGFVLSGGSPMGGIAGGAVEELLRKGISSQKGREIVKYMAKKGRGHINALELDQMLGKATAGAMAGSVPGVTGAGAPEGMKPFVDEE